MVQASQIATEGEIVDFWKNSAYLRNWPVATQMKSEKLKQEPDQLEHNLRSGQEAHWQCVMLLVKLIQVEIEKDTMQVFLSETYCRRYNG